MRLPLSRFGDVLEAALMDAYAGLALTRHPVHGDLPVMHLIVTKLYGMRHNNCDLLKVDFACVPGWRRGYLHTLTLHMVY